VSSLFPFVTFVFAFAFAVISSSVQILENIPIAPFTTLRVGGPARYFVETRSEAEIVEALSYAREHALEVFVLGGGSNLVVADAGWPGLILKIAIAGIEATQQDGKCSFVSGAGEDWDKFVAYAVEEHCAGLECMSGIPGTVGGTPVQNVGAYGQEVAETITSVRAIDTRGGKIRELTNGECGFAYRTSIFNTSAKGQYIVTRVSFSLTKDGSPRVEYADLKRYFTGEQAEPNLQQVRDAVRSIRASKAMLLTPDDDDCRSAGSFFKNPIISSAEYEHIATLPASHQQKPPQFTAPNGQVKVSAAWLVERSGFPKGFTEGQVGISRKHSLAIVNRGGATAAEIVNFKDKVQAGVLKTFGVQLHPEPVFVGF